MVVYSLSSSIQLLIPSNYYHTNYFPTTTTTTTKLKLIPLQTHFLSKCCYSDNKVYYFINTTKPSLRKSKSKRWSKVIVFASGNKESPYQVLGVSSNANINDIKRAYRKLALKYHPDVNKEANAQEKFMRIKHAYNTLLSSDSRKRYDSGSQSSEAARNRAQEEEEFYGFGELLRDVESTLGDFFRDLQEEFQNWEANASSQGKPKSLWEELADIGEEFVEFLEKELNITDEDTDVEQDKQDSFAGQRRNDINGGDGIGSGIMDSIDEIEATLAKLKKELGL